MQEMIVPHRHAHTRKPLLTERAAALLQCAMLLLALCHVSTASASEVHVTAIAKDLEVILLPGDRETGSGAAVATAEFIPLSGSVRDRVEQRLRELRVQFRQLGLHVEVGARPGQGPSRLLANQFASMLANAYLASSGLASDNPLAPAGVMNGIVVTANPGDRPVVNELLEALSPTLSGALLLHLDVSVQTARVHMAVLGGLAFLPDGKVKLPQLDIPSA